MKRCISVVAYILVLVGALNWGLWGFFQFDLVAWLFGGNTSWISRLVYALIGLSGLWMLGSFTSCCRHLACKSGQCSECSPHKQEQKEEENK